MKQISLLGSTGSIGTQTLEVARRHPDKIQVVALSARKNLEKLAEQILEFHPSFVAVPDDESIKTLKKFLGDAFGGEIEAGPAALIRAATLRKATHVVMAVVGSLGLLPTLEALKSSKTVALANKETLVTGGHLVKEALNKSNGSLLPIDSEHSAIFQCLKGEKIQEVKQIWLTASGGPFRGFSREKIRQVTKAQVLSHPVWKMGNKITVDSASLMNKGLEVIEASWLFNLSPDQIQVVVHPQGIIHSMVEFVDGSVVAQLGLPDMKTPIQIALSFPERWEAPPPKLDLAQVATLTFEKPDLKAFPLLKLAFDVARLGGTLPAVLNAANEEAVRLFLEDSLSFSEIAEVVHEAVASHKPKQFPSLEEILESDRWARQFISERRIQDKNVVFKP